MMQFIQDHMAMILGGLFAVSEVLAGIPSVKSNSVFQMVFNALKSLSGHNDQPEQPK